MRNLRYVTLVAVVGLSLAACSSGMSDDKMMETKTSDAKMADTKMSEAKMADTKMAGDKMAGDKMAAETMMPMGVMVEQSSHGEVLADKMGMTLYTYDRDHPGTSNCYDNCANNWPPLMASGDAKATGDFTVVERKDGTMQWALKGMPLYTWVKDTKPGEVTGDGVGGVWHAAMAPSGEKMMK